MKKQDTPRFVIRVGTKFDTPFEKGCIATTEPTEWDNFDAMDSDGVECVFNMNMVTHIWPCNEEHNYMDYRAPVRPSRH